MEGSKVKRYVFIFISIPIMILFTIILYCFSFNHLDYFIKLHENQDLHYNLITFNSVIAGFLFSGLSIIISLISNANIKRLWDNGYMDCMYKAGALSILLSVLSILISFSQIIIKISKHGKIKCVLVDTEICLSLTSIILFIYCVRELLYSIKLLRNNKK